MMDDKHYHYAPELLAAQRSAGRMGLASGNHLPAYNTTLGQETWTSSVSGMRVVMTATVLIGQAGGGAHCP